MDHDWGMRVITNEADGKGIASGKKDKKSFTVEDLWAELQRVRAALVASEERAARLEQRVKELEDENARITKGRQTQENFLQGKIRKLERDVSDRDKKIEKLEKQIEWLNRQVFGKNNTEKHRPEAAEADEDAGPRREDKTADAEMLKTRITELNMPQRVEQALDAASIRTVGGLVRKREDDLLAIEGLGQKGLQDIKRALSNLGLTLRSQ